VAEDFDVFSEVVIGVTELLVIVDLKVRDKNIPIHPNYISNIN